MGMTGSENESDEKDIGFGHWPGIALSQTHEKNVGLRQPLAKTCPGPRANTGLNFDSDSAILKATDSFQNPGKPLSTAERKRRQSGRTTLNDVARAAEVSPITVSRALRGERSVAPELVERVKQAAARLGYVPDPAARALASQRSAQVPVLVPLLSNALFVDVLEAVHNTLQPHGFQTLIGVTHYDPAQEEQLLRSYLPHRPAGILVTGFDRTEGARQLLADSGVPCVHLMELTQAKGVYCVGFSQLEAGHAITTHLLQQGRRRIGFIAAQLDPRTLQRAEGYRRALREQGLYDAQLELLSAQPSSMALGGELFDTAAPRPTRLRCRLLLQRRPGTGWLAARFAHRHPSTRAHRRGRLQRSLWQRPDGASPDQRAHTPQRHGSRRGADAAGSDAWKDARQQLDRSGV